MYVSGDERMETEEQSEDTSGLEDLASEEEGGEVEAAASLAIAESLTPKLRSDPSAPPYPRGLVLDILLKTAPLPDLLEAYKLSVDDFRTLTHHPVFRQDMRDMKERMREEGFSFRVKAQAQAEAYLGEAWKLVHTPDTPANVKADLIKWTTKVANLEPKAKDNEQSMISPQTVEQLRGLSQQDLEIRVMQIIMRKQPNEIQINPINR